MGRKIPIQYILSVVTALIECVFCAGLIFGWTSLSFVLKSNGYFSKLCPEPEENIVNASKALVSTLAPIVTNLSYTPVDSSTQTIPIGILAQSVGTGAAIPVYPTCAAQDTRLNLVFTVASATLSFSTLPNGYLFDHLGTWFSRCIATSLFLLASILMILSSVDTSWLLFPAMCCFSVGGILLLVTNMQLGGLFGPARSSVITLLNGGLDSSSFVFLLVKLANEKGVAMETIFQFIACLSLFQAIRTFLLMPRRHIPSPLPKGIYRYGIAETVCLQTERTKKLPVEIEMKLTEVTSDEVGAANVNGSKDDVDSTVKTASKSSFWDCIRTVKFWLNLMHMSVLQLRNYFFLGTFVTWLETIVEPDSFGFYINIFGVFQFFGVGTAPLNGIMIDVTTRIIKKSCGNVAIANLKAVAMSVSTTSILGVLFSITVAIPNARLQFVSFVLQVVFRSFLYGGNASFLALMFPGEHFGKLYGSTMTLAGVVSLLQFPLFTLVMRVFNNNFTVMNVIFIFVCAATLAHPLNLMVSAQKVGQLETKDASSDNVEEAHLVKDDSAEEQTVVT